MSRDSYRQQRATRKLLLQLQADAYRLEIAAQVSQLRSPMLRAKASGRWLSMISHPSRLITVAIPLLLRGGRYETVLKVLPVAITAWKLAEVVRKHMSHQTVAPGRRSR